MNCRECLDELATGSLRDLTPDSAVSRHAVACPDCGPLLTQLRDREYEAATILNGLPPLDNPITVAETAGRLARRRRIGSVAVTLTAIALGLTIWFAADTIVPDLVRSDRMSRLETQTFPLSCLSAEQAGEMISPYVRSHGSAYYPPPPGTKAITVRATASELAEVNNVLRNFDNGRKSVCQVTISPDQLRQQLDQLQKALSDQQNQPVIAGQKSTQDNPSPPRR